MAALWAGRIWSKLLACGSFRLFSASRVSTKSGMVWLLFGVGRSGFKAAFSVHELFAVRRLFQGAEAVGGDHLHTLRWRIHQAVQRRQQVWKTIARNKTVQPTMKLPYQVRRGPQLQRFQPLVQLVDALNVDAAVATAAVHFLKNWHLGFTAQVAQAQVQFAEQQLVIAGGLAEGVVFRPLLRPQTHQKARAAGKIAAFQPFAAQAQGFGVVFQRAACRRNAPWRCTGPCPGGFCAGSALPPGPPPEWVCTEHSG